MFFKNKIEIYSNEIPIDFLKNFITIYPKNLPDYYKNIPKLCPFSSGKRNIKKCSGLINYYRRAIVFKSPCDISIKLDREKKEFQCLFGNGSLNNNKRIEIHTDDQFLDFTSNKKYFKIIKILFNIWLKTDIPLIISNPWWSLNDFDMVPGIINANPPSELNLFLGFRHDQNSVNIAQNTPLCVIHTESEKPIKLIFKKNQMISKNYNGFEYLFLNLKNRLLNNKFTKE